MLFDVFVLPYVVPQAWFIIYAWVVVTSVSLDITVDSAMLQHAYSKLCDSFLFASSTAVVHEAAQSRHALFIVMIKRYSGNVKMNGFHIQQSATANNGC